ncbi:50S ribosomal protein P1 [Halobacteriales archaeon QS_8_69_26]|nr:MAG: 50S ribosomal protein P1 [Halobacteriales archaeon QS_8_69_26]
MEYVYAALVLHKADKEVTEETLTDVLEAAGIEVDDARVKSLVAAMEDVDIETALTEAVAAPAAGAGGGGTAAETTTEADESEDEAEEEAEAEEADEDDDEDEDAGEGLGELFG